MAHFDDDDSNHSVNGWIKKEIEDDDFEEYMKQAQHDDYPSSERYEELMSLSKEDLVGRILQQEEDIRYLQDIRHGLEKNVEGFSSSCSHFKKLLEVMTSTVTTLKNCQQQAAIPGITSASSSSDSRSAGIATTLTNSRSTASAPTSQASPRSTPTVPASVPPPAASPRSAPSITTTQSNTRSSASTVTVPSNHMSTSNLMSNDRMHGTATSMSSHQTVTITRQTNVIIKTEIPSPPPSEPMIASTPLISQSVPTVNMPQPNAKSRAEPQASTYFTRQQNPVNSVNPAKSYASTSSRSITDIANSIPPNKQRAKGNSGQSFSAGMTAAAKGNTQANRTNLLQQQQFHAQRHPSPVQGAVGRGMRCRPNFSQRAAPYTTQKQMRQTAGMGSSPVRPRMPVNANAPPGKTDSSMNDLLANISFKVPSGITLSIVPTKSGESKNPMSQHLERSAAGPTVAKQAAMESSSRPNVPHALHSPNTPLIEEITTSKSPADKAVSSAGATNASFSAINTMSSMNVNFSANEDDDDEEDDYFDEIAVLIPDKKTSPNLEGSNQQNLADGIACGAVAISEAKGQGPSGEPYWNSQNPGQKSVQAAYQNNAEYMFEETDDIDSDENEAKVYLGENVSLPREIVDTCIKQGPTPTKLTRNLMKALFPDLRELASGCPEGDVSKPMQPLLPANKVKAIIALVQKTFPQVNRAAVVMTMNLKCKEAKALLSRSTQPYASY